VSYSSEVLARSPKAYYRCQEASGNIQDSSTLAHHSTSVTGSPIYHASGPIASDPGDYSMGLPGTAYFSIPNHADLTFGDTLSVGAWIYKSDVGITRAYTGRGSGALTLGTDASNLLFAARADIGAICYSNVALSIDTWYYAVFTKTGATIKLYLNANDVTTSITNQTLASPAVPLIVGADYNGTLGWYGAVDELMYYSTVLSAADVAAIYAAATGQSILPDADVAAGGWTTTPLFSKINDASDATVITATAS